MLDSTDQIPLFDKVRGANAVPVAALLVRAEAAMAVINREYLSFVRSTLPQHDDILSEAARNPGATGPWRQLRQFAHDLRSSSATAGYDCMSAVASSLERLLEGVTSGDLGIVEVVGLHMDALRYMAGNGPPSDDDSNARELLGQLERASRHVAGRG